MHNPKDHDGLAAFGGCLSVLGRHQEAIRTCETAVRLGPEAANSHFNLAVAYSNAEQHQAAADAFAEATRLKPGWVQAHLGSAEELCQLGRAEESLTAFRRALAIDSKALDADSVLREMYEKVEARTKA